MGHIRSQEKPSVHALPHAVDPAQSGSVTARFLLCIHFMSPAGRAAARIRRVGSNYVSDSSGVLLWMWYKRRIKPGSSRSGSLRCWYNLDLEECRDRTPVGRSMTLGAGMELWEGCELRAATRIAPGCRKAREAKMSRGSTQQHVHPCTQHRWINAIHQVAPPPNEFGVWGARSRHRTVERKCAARERDRARIRTARCWLAAL